MCNDWPPVPRRSRLMDFDRWDRPQVRGHFVAQVVSPAVTTHQVNELLPAPFVS
jgi:hypothetical protein